MQGEPPDEDDGQAFREYVETWTHCHRPNFTGFTGLTELVLDRLFFPVYGWYTILGTLLRNNASTLRVLHMSLCPEALDFHESIDPIDTFDDVFNNICGAYYGGQYDTGESDISEDEDGEPHPPPLTTSSPPPPLRLRELRLGNALYPAITSDEQEENLARFMDLSSLRRVMFLSKWEEDHGEFQDMRASRIFLSPHNCPQLQSFGIEEITQDDTGPALAAVVRDHPQFAAGLAMSFWNPFLGNEIPLIRKPKAASYQFTRPLIEGGLRQLDLHLDYLGGSGQDNNPPNAEQILTTLGKSRNARTLQGLMVYTSTTEETTSSGEVDGTRFMHLKALLDVLPKLQALRQLSVVPYRSFNSPVVEAIVSLEAGEQVARQLAKAGPHLRYVQVENQYWRVWRTAVIGDAEDLVMEPLEDREIDEVELWDRPVCGRKWKWKEEGGKAKLDRPL